MQKFLQFLLEFRKIYHVWSLVSIIVMAATMFSSNYASQVIVEAVCQLQNIDNHHNHTLNTTPDNFAFGVVRLIRVYEDATYY